MLPVAVVCICLPVPFSGSATATAPDPAERLPSPSLRRPKLASLAWVRRRSDGDGRLGGAFGG